MASPPAPWETWELDAAFFTALSRWTKENPDTSLDRVLIRVDLAIQYRREFFEAIPDSVFPARGLVKALAHLIKLGKTVATANSDVQSFAQDIVRWVEETRATFMATQSDWWDNHLTSTTWKNLAGIRDVIDSICQWAASRLLDQRWSLSGIRHRLAVREEIDAFRARIAEARAIFNQREARKQHVAQILSLQAVQNTSYVQQGKTPCDKDTHVEVLKEILSWVEDTALGSQSFLWLTGDPGCGKSAVTASIARTCKDKGCLWAQFFINRNNIDTTNPNAYFPSIACQLAERSDIVELEIHDQLKAKPSLVDEMSSEQAISLFIAAIRVASLLDPSKPVVVVIDGLDETDRKHLKSTADIFSHLFDVLTDYPNAKVFISSRTEDNIRNPFARTMNSTYVKHLHLDVNAESSIRDVSSFLRRKIAQIVLDNDLDWYVWPGEERMELLSKRAAGLFIWAVTAAKFFQEQIETMGTECLDTLLGSLNSDGMGDINTLYSIILSITYKGRTDDWAFESFRRIIGAIVVPT